MENSFQTGLSTSLVCNDRTALGCPFVDMSALQLTMLVPDASKRWSLRCVRVVGEFVWRSGLRERQVRSGRLCTDRRLGVCIVTFGWHLERCGGVITVLSEPQFDGSVSHVGVERPE